MMSRSRLRSVLTVLFIALGASLILHAVLFVIVASNGNESSALARAAEAMLAPAEAITERLLPGHSEAQIIDGFAISVVLYAAALCPVVALLRLRRDRA